MAAVQPHGAPHAFRFTVLPGRIPDIGLLPIVTGGPACSTSASSIAHMHWLAPRTPCTPFSGCILPLILLRASAVLFRSCCVPIYIGSTYVAEALLGQLLGNFVGTFGVAKPSQAR